MWSRIHLIPLLQAEEDRDLARRHMADQAREKQLTGDNFKVYNSDRFVLDFPSPFFYVAWVSRGYICMLILSACLQICAPDIRRHPRQHHEIEYRSYRVIRCGMAGKAGSFLFPGREGEADEEEAGWALRKEGPCTYISRHKSQYEAVPFPMVNHDSRYLPNATKSPVNHWDLYHCFGS